MVAVSIEDLKERAEDLLRQVQETGEPVEIVDGGQAVARLVPTEEEIERIKDRQTLEALAELDRIGEEAARHAPPGETDEAAILAEDDEVRRWLAEMDALAEEIGKAMPPGTSVADIMNDIRREL
jgi:prevent-host-death family protein